MAYTPIIAAPDLADNIYQEKLNSITRSDSTILDRKINAGLQEVKNYLSRFDLVALFGDPVADTAATFTDEYLNMLVRDVVCWHVVTLANVGVDLEVLRTRYKDAIHSLERIQDGRSSPKWPYVDNTDVTTPPSNEILIAANPERKNYY